ncbi:MAG: dTDP-4-dehydrorhamnose reductase [Candidatus Fischerbacteria bacterium RBG_13_37_8]|uniref:dTDP-4-dehydrorhamnose reductase n=1 Tax=Candidatus Fischerbacteria bacterium RBG_13_37_8 TaxID=1817863 RepID=A0A1F5VSZ0_9BACT|nr:MAG: dTDP-4-dehydrorhamnose reductase [Candidatus Fischerbacteria bacterium RBG_13_37_8]
MKLLVTGAKGMLGTDLVALLKENGNTVFETDIEELDITSFQDITVFMQEAKPEIVINCAGYTQVDRAEEEPELANLLNGTAVKHLATACANSNIPLCHISTDYVFDGEKEGAYLPEDVPNPIGAYGASKLAGERYLLDICRRYYLIRTSWLYGKNGNNFVRTMLRLAKERNELRVVHDQIGSPTWTVTLARIIYLLIQTAQYGIYHAADETNGGISWYEFACEIMRVAGYTIPVIPIETKDFKSLARRPKNSLLDLTKTKEAIKEEIPEWNDSLYQFINKGLGTGD